MAWLKQDILFYASRCGWVGAILYPGLHSLLLYRIGHCLYHSQHRYNPFWYIYLLVAFFFRGVSKIEIPETATIGSRLLLPHAHGLVVGPNTTIGDDCTIGPWVVLGHNGVVGEDPRIGNRVYIAPHACVLGHITLGNGVLVGANTVVTEDIPAGATVSNADVKIKFC